MEAIVQTDTTNRYGNWLQTYSGRQFWPLDPTPEDIYIEDIAHALSMTCRFGGHALEFYSVAEHCCHVSDTCPEKDRLWGLLHDGSEAYIGDVIRPIKPHLQGYKRIEWQLMQCICLRFGLPLIQPGIVKTIDNRILANEALGIMAPQPVPWEYNGEPIPNLHLPCWSPQQAEKEFLTRFYALYKGE